MNIETGLVQPVVGQQAIQTAIEEFSYRLNIPGAKVSQFVSRLIALPNALSSSDLNTWYCYLPLQTPGWHYNKPKKMAKLPKEVQAEIEKTRQYFDHWVVRTNKKCSAIFGGREYANGSESMWMIVQWSQEPLPSIGEVRDVLRQKMLEKERWNPRFFKKWYGSGIGIGLYSLIFWAIWLGLSVFGMQWIAEHSVNRGSAFFFCMVASVFWFTLGFIFHKSGNGYPAYRHFAEACNERTSCA